MSSSGDENSHGFMSVDSASGTWSDGSKVVFAILEQDSVCGDLASYAVFTVNSDKSIDIRLYSYENSITIPDEWGVNYIEIQPMLSASYSAKIYTR